MISMPAISQNQDSVVRELPSVVIEKSRLGSLNLSSFESQWQADSLNYFFGGADGAAEVLSRIPGIYIRDYGGHGGLQTVSLRGLANNTTQVQLDGIWVPELQTGVFDLNGWLLDGLESVAVSSINSAGVGSYSGAWVNLSSGLPRRLVRSGAGSFGERTWGVSELLKLGTSRVGLQYRFLSAHDRFPFEWNEMRSVRDNADYHLHQFGLIFRQPLASQQLLTYRLWGFDRQQGVPGPVVKGNTGTAEERMHQLQYLMYLNWQGCKPRFSWSVAVSQRLNQMNLNDRAATDNYELNSLGFQADLRCYNSRWDWELGIRTHRTELQGNRLGTGFKPLSQVSREESHVGAALTWHTVADSSSINREPWRITLRIGHSTVSAYNPEPQLGLQAQHILIQNAKIWLYFEGLRGIRYPSFNELYYFAFGNPELAVERVWSGQLGLLWRRDRNASSTLRFSVFANQTENKIISVPVSPVRWTTFSLGRTESWGLELASTIAVSRWIRCFTSVDWLIARDFSLTRGGELPYFPRWLAQFGSELRWSKYWISSSIQYTGTRYASLINDNFYRLNAFLLVDGNLGRVIQSGSGDRLVLEAGVQNVLAERYVLIQSFPMPGRTLWLRLTWQPS